MTSGILGAVAATLALGAVHLETASGNDLFAPGQRGDASVFDSRTFESRTTGLSSQGGASQGSTSTTQNINRSAKGDRDAVTRGASGSTMSFMMPGVPDGSILVRVPSADAADARKPLAPTTSGSNAPRGSAGSQRAIACEPSVSVLTAVAKQLEPGRCIT